ncbi:MAG: virginiamycin B lyase family protein [Acidimicrobiales bacterium]
MKCFGRGGIRLSIGGGVIAAIVGSTLVGFGLMSTVIPIPESSAANMPTAGSPDSQPSITMFSGASHPVGIAAGADGALWFTNSGNNTIGRITTSGTVTSYSGTGIHEPGGIALGADGALWFTNSVDSIGRITTSGTVTKYTDTGMAGPEDIAAGPDGALWFTNGRNRTIGRITTAGTVSNYAGPGIDDPYKITAGPDGALWFTNGRTDSIGRITTGGTVTNYTGTGVSAPAGMTAGPDGALWFGNLHNDSIGRITTGGTVTNYTGTGVAGPGDIAAGPDGALWFTNYRNGSIGRITTGGTVTNYTDTGINTPEGITAGSDGALWFTSYGNNSIGRIGGSPAGISPASGPYSGGTVVTITGQDFTDGDGVTFGGRPATLIAYKSPTLITAEAPSIPISAAGSTEVIVTAPGSGRRILDIKGGYAYYVPAIGVLIFHDHRPYSGGDEFSRCTAAVVQSPSGSAVATAGHCVSDGCIHYPANDQPYPCAGTGHVDGDWAFAPGYTGPVCPNGSAAAAFLTCGNHPLGIWLSSTAAIDQRWLDHGGGKSCTGFLTSYCVSDHSLDFGFLDMKAGPIGSPHRAMIQEAVGGGLKIVFNQRSVLNSLGPGLILALGRAQTWIAFGQPANSLLEAIGPATDEFVGNSGPPAITVQGNLPQGSSGGPWLSSSDQAIGGVNSTSDSGRVRGTYLGDEALLVFNSL